MSAKRVLEAMALANNLPVDYYIRLATDPQLDTLDEELSMASDAEIEVLADGEDVAMERLVERMAAHRSRDILENLFEENV